MLIFRGVGLGYHHLWPPNSHGVSRYFQEDFVFEICTKCFQLIQAGTWKYRPLGKGETNQPKPPIFGFKMRVFQGLELQPSILSFEDSGAPRLQLYCGRHAQRLEFSGGWNLTQPSRLTWGITYLFHGPKWLSKKSEQYQTKIGKKCDIWKESTFSKSSF